MQKRNRAGHGLVDPELMQEIRKDLPEQRIDSQRQLKYFVVPGGRRLTEYEVLTIYAQQGTDWAGGGLETGDAGQKWPGGRPTYAPETTELKTTDWWRFRDPAGKWFFPYIKDKAEEGRINNRFMRSYASDGAIRSMDRFWAQDMLMPYYGAFLFSEYGLYNAHASVVHDCLSDMIRVFFSNIAFDKNDAAQLVQTQRVFMHKLVPELSDELAGPKELWLKSPLFRGARETVEELWSGTYDHMEAIWAIYGIYEPIVGQYIRREFFQRVGPYFGDTLTPWFTAQTIGFHHYAVEGVRALYFKALMEDPEYGDVNRRWLQAWTGKWLPKVIGALNDFQGIYREIENTPVAETSRVEASVRRVLMDWQSDFAQPLSYAVDCEGLIKEVMKTETQHG